MGLILAGALMGAGRFGQQLQRQWGAEELEKMREDAATARQNALILAEKEKVELTAATNLRYAGPMGEAAARAAVVKQEALAPGESKAAKEKADLEVDVAKRKPRSIAEGHTEIVDGKPGFTAPKTAVPKAPEELAEMSARADYLKAAAEAMGRKDKPLFPKLMKGDAEGSFFIDQNTNALGTVIPAEPGKPGEKNWIFPDKPEVKDKPASMVWSVGGETMTDREYNQRFYGHVNPVSGQSGSPAAAPGRSKIDWSTFLGGKARPEKSDATRRGIISARESSESEAAAAAVAVQDAFNMDRRTMTPKQLAEKYAGSPEYGSLTAQQKAVIFKARNQGR